MRRSFLILLAIGLALVPVVALVMQWFSQPTILRVAVGPVGGEDTRLMVAMAQNLAREREPVRFKLVMTEGALSSAEAINTGQADLAIIRSDVAIPPKGQTIVIFHRDVSILAAPEGSKLAAISDLKGKNIGILRGSIANQNLFQTILNHYEVPSDQVKVTSFDTIPLFQESLKLKKVDAVFAAGPLSGGFLKEMIAALTSTGGGAPVFIPIGEADAMAQRRPVIESTEIVRGAFGGTPPRPAEPLTSLGFSHRLVGNASLDEDIVAEVTRLIFTTRAALSSEFSNANYIEAPDTSKGSTLQVHPGAAAYYDGEVQTFMDRYGDWFYLLVMVGSIAGSSVMGIASISSVQRRKRALSLLDQLLNIVREARTTQDWEKLQDLEERADSILESVFSIATGGHVDTATIAAFTLGFDQARLAIHEQRKLIDHGMVYQQAAE